MVFNLLDAIFPVVAVSSRQVFGCKLFYQTFCFGIELLWKTDSGVHYFVVNCHRVVFLAERCLAVHHLIYQYSKCIPVNSLAVSEVLTPLRTNYFRSHVLWCPAESRGSLPEELFLDKTEVRQLDVPVIAYKHIFRLQISIEYILIMKMLQNENKLSNDKFDAFNGILDMRYHAHQVAVLHELSIETNTLLIL